MEINFCNSNNKDYQKKLNNLLKDVFFDFKFFYDLDLWNKDYESYSITIDHEIVSNICIYKTHIIFNAQQIKALSIGAVATREDYRGRGYSKYIMEYIFEKYPNMPMYLSANDDVIEFYKKLGFSRVYEKEVFIKESINNDLVPQLINYNDPIIWHYLEKRVNFSSTLDCLNAQAINMFHIHFGYLKDSIYLLVSIDTLLIAKQNKNQLHITGVFSKKYIRFSDLVESLPFKGVTEITFGFMPSWEDCSYQMRDYKCDALFVKNINCDLGDFKFPELAIT